MTCQSNVTESESPEPMEPLLKLKLEKFNLKIKLTYNLEWMDYFLLKGEARRQVIANLVLPKITKIQ